MTLRPALTLIETLIALTLLGSIAVAGLRWSVLISDRLGNESASGQWRAAAERALDRIERDLLVGDHDPIRSDQPFFLGSVAIPADNALTIATRQPGIGPTVRTYAVDDASLITRTTTWRPIAADPTPIPAQPAATRLPLVSSVVHFEARITQLPAGQSRLLTVSITGPDRATVSRSFPLEAPE